MSTSAAVPDPPGTLIGSFSHNTAGKADVSVETFLLALGYISTGLRLWSRRLQRSRLQVNDWLIIVAMVSLISPHPRPTLPPDPTLLNPILVLLQDEELMLTNQ